MDTKLGIFKAVANQKRLIMIKLLGKRGRLTLREISRTLDIPEATACRNLKILESVGFVKSTIYKATAEYWLNRDKNLILNWKILNIILDEKY